MFLKIGIDEIVRGFGVVLIFIGIGIFLSAVIFMIHQVSKNKKNNNEPVESVIATIVTKRIECMDLTWYYITFEFDDGNRKEFLVSGKVYGMCAEKDKGELKYQGKKFINFIRL